MGRTGQSTFGTMIFYFTGKISSVGMRFVGDVITVITLLRPVERPIADNDNNRELFLLNSYDLGSFFLLLLLSFIRDAFCNLLTIFASNSKTWHSVAETKVI